MVTRPRASRRLHLVAGLVVAVTTTGAIGLLVPALPHPRVADAVSTSHATTHLGVSRLVTALGQVRLTEGRFTGGFRYGPPPRVSRGTQATREHSLRLLAAAAAARQAAETSPDARNLRAAGIAAVLLGDWETGVSTLEAAADLEPQMADVQTDLAVAYMSRAAATARDDDWPRALMAVERALRVAPSSPEALFNRAFALERLHLPEQARLAWDACLQVEGDPAWRGEAARLRSGLDTTAAPPLDEALARFRDSDPAEAADLAQTLVRMDAQRAREFLEDELLGTWPAGDAETAAVIRWRDRAIVLAEALARGGDVLPLAAVRAYASSRGQARQALDEAARRWRAGRHLYASYEMARMTEAFTEAADAFARGGSPMGVWARHYRVVGLYYLGRIDEADEECRAALAEAEARGYRALKARLRWDAGTLHFQRGHFERALHHYQAASEEFAAIGERDNEVAMHQLMAEAYGRLGDAASSWRHHRAALGGLARVRDERRRHTVLAAAGYSSLNLQMPDVALHLFDTALRHATSRDVPVLLVEAHLNRARALVATGRHREARDDIDTAWRQLQRISDEPMLNRFTGDLLAARAEARLEEDPPGALEDVTRALEHGAAAASEFRLAGLHLLGGRAALRQGRLDLAAAAFERGIANLESRRAVIQQRTLRVSFMDSVWSLYAERIRMAAQERDHVSALNWLERSRARMLLDDLQGPGHQPSRIPAIQARLESDQGIVYFLTLDDRLMAWLVTRGDIAFAETAITPATLRRHVARLRHALDVQDHAAVSQGVRALGAWVIDPLRLTDRGLSLLAISPDELLEPLPFSALTDRHGRHLVQALATVVVPSGSTLTTTPRQRPTGITRLAVIGATTPEAELARQLPPLPSAALEVRDLAALYDGAEMLTGPTATPAAFLSALAGSDVVHFAGHALADPSLPWQARLILSSDGTSSGALALDTLTPGSSRARLVVLAACETGLGRGSRGEGLLSLSRPLLASGVRNVVVTKWKVDDAAMRTLARTFHQRLQAPGATPATALREAQLSVIGEAGASVPTYDWAMLEVQGSFT